MRMNEFYAEIRKQFPVTLDWELAHEIASAMQEANTHGDATFAYEGVVYKITAKWVCGCISGDCNPATCWTHWEISSEA